MAVVEQERRGKIEILRFNRPEARNAISPEVSVAMGGLLDAADDRPRGARGRRDRHRAGVLGRRRPQGGCPGPRRRDRRRARRLRRHRHPRLPEAAHRRGQRSRARAADSRSCCRATSSSRPTPPRFGIPEVQRGLMAAAGGLIRLPKRVPLAIALEHDDDRRPDHRGTRARARARQPRGSGRARARRSHRARGAHRRELPHRRAPLPPTRARGDGAHRGRGAGSAPYELSLDVFSSGDAIEGATAFAEKRPPVWKSS